MKMRIIWCTTLLLATSACGAIAPKGRDMAPPSPAYGGTERQELGELSSLMSGGG